MKTTRKPSQKIRNDRKKKAIAVDGKKVLALFKSGKSTGEICVALDRPRNSASREAVRVILRDAGVYEKRTRKTFVKGDQMGATHE